MTLMNGHADPLSRQITRAGIVIQRVEHGDYKVIKDNTGKLGNTVSPKTALELRNDSEHEASIPGGRQGYVLILPVEIERPVRRGVLS